MKQIGLFVCFIVIVFSAQAQAKKDSTVISNRNRERQAVKKELGLSRKQAREIKSVRKNYNGRLKAIGTDSTLSQEQQKQQKHQLLKERQQKTDSLLTPQQRVKARELMKEKRKEKKASKASGELKKNE
jgi:periplasmic protein CpxP/Spy